MKSERFEAVLTAGHKEDAVEVPFDPATHWSRASESLRPGRRGVRVDAEIGGHRFEGAVVSRSRRHWLPVPAAVCKAAAIAVGDEVTVRLAPHGPAAPGTSTPRAAIANGSACVVTAGRHKGRAGRVEDLHASATGHLTITVVEADGTRFKTLAKNVEAAARRRS
ncbi:MAG: DUF1905 domain-containing protein [Xanthomonadales bacterium]|nr:DUF1905 domain-containing protein [Xanthomonadales bacterium]